MNRRRYLLSAGCTLATVAGCMQNIEDTSGQDENESDTPDPSQDVTETVTLGAADGPGTWPQLAHDARNTSYVPGASGPHDAVDVAWNSLGERSVFQPVVNDDLYLTEDWTGGAAISLDSTDGTEKWINPSLPQIRWAPALHGDRMLVITRTESNEVRLHTLDIATGDEQWSRESGVTASSSSRPPTGPTVTDDHAYIGSNTGVIALDATTGDIVWDAKLDDHVIDIEGGPTWRTDWATPAVTEERVYTFDLNDSHEKIREVYAVNRDTGDRDWTAQIELSDGWFLEGHVVAGSDHVFVMALDPHITTGHDDSEWSGTQQLYALDAASGAIDWQWELGGRMLGPPAYAEGVLFVGTWDPDADTGKLHVMDGTNQSTSWIYSTDAGGIATPAVTSDIIYLRQGQELAAIAVEDGTLDWRLSFDEDLSAPLIANDTVYALTGGGRDSDNYVVAVRGQ